MANIKYRPNNKNKRGENLLLKLPTINNKLMYISMTFHIFAVAFFMQLFSCFISGSNIFILGIPSTFIQKKSFRKASINNIKFYCLHVNKHIYLCIYCCCCCCYYHGSGKILSLLFIFPTIA